MYTKFQCGRQGGSKRGELGGFSEGGGGVAVAESRASTIRKSGVEIRNFARHHQRETFPTSRAELGDWA